MNIQAPKRPKGKNISLGSMADAIRSAVRLDRFGHKEAAENSAEREDFGHSFEDEVFFSLRHQRDTWARVAAGSVLASVVSLGCLVAVLPLKETKAFVVMVDKTTGDAEKLVQVRPASLDQQEAVLQAELVSYVTDRETYDPADNFTRIPDVMSRSQGGAADTLASLWTSTSDQYPPHIYGRDVRIRVVVKSVSINPSKGGAADIARIRINKIREEKGQSTAERTFVVTMSYAFKPKDGTSLSEIWKNPLGFTALSYRIDAESAAQ